MHANGGCMKGFENELDRIRIELYEKTKGMEEEIILNVNSNTKKIAQEFGINIKTGIEKKLILTVNV